MTFVLCALAVFLVGAAVGIFIASLCTISEVADLQDEIYRLSALLYQLGHRA